MKHDERIYEKNYAGISSASKPYIPPPPQVVREVEIVKPEPPKAIMQPIPKSETIEVVFDPAPIDRDRTQVFILQIDIVTKKVKTYKTVGRRTIR